MDITYKYFVERDGRLITVYRVNMKNKLFSSWDKDLGDFYDETENEEVGEFTFDDRYTENYAQREIPRDVAYIIAPVLEDL